MPHVCKHSFLHISGSYLTFTHTYTPMNALENNLPKDTFGMQTEAPRYRTTNLKPSMHINTGSVCNLVVLVLPYSHLNLFSTCSTFWLKKPSSLLKSRQTITVTAKVQVESENGGLLNQKLFVKQPTDIMDYHNGDVKSGKVFKENVRKDTLAGRQRLSFWVSVKTC